MDSVKIIKSKSDHDAAIERLSTLLDLEPESGTDAAYELDALAAIIEAYERQQGFFVVSEPVTALDIIKFRMAQNGLTQKDMTAYLGSPSKVSEVLSGKRPLSLAMIKKLHHGLHIPADLLLEI